MDYIIQIQIHSFNIYPNDMNYFQESNIYIYLHSLSKLNVTDSWNIYA